MKTRGILQRARRRKKEPEGACTVLLEPGAGFQGSGTVAEDSCSFRPYKHAAKPIFYTFSDAIVQRRFICVEGRKRRQRCLRGTGSSWQRYLLLRLPNVITARRFFPTQQTIRGSRREDNQTKKCKKKDGDGHICNYLFVSFKNIQ